MRALEAAGDALHHEYRTAGSEEPAQRRADAVGLLAERALVARFTDEAPISGTRAQRFQVILHVEPETHSSEGAWGRSELEDGTRVSAESCDRAMPVREEVTDVN